MKKILIAFSVLGILAWSCSKDDSTKKNNFDRAGLITNMANNAVLPSLDELSTEAENFFTAAETFKANANNSNLDLLKNQWKNLATSWQNSKFFMVKDLKYSGQEQEIAYWPAHTSKIDGLLSSSSQINVDFIKGLGANQKGLFALEYVLFNQDFNTISGNSQAIDFIVSTAQNINLGVNELKSVWTNAYQPKFIASTDNFVTSTIPTLTNRMIEYAEWVKNTKIGYPLALSKYTTIDDAKLESIYAKYSVELIEQNITTLKSVYQGYNASAIGFDDYLLSFGTKGIELDKKIQNQFLVLENLLSTLPKPAFNNLTNKKTDYTEFHTEVKTLIKLLKTEFIILLEVTPTFSDADGD